MDIDRPMQRFQVNNWQHCISSSIADNKCILMSLNMKWAELHHYLCD